MRNTGNVHWEADSVLLGDRVQIGAMSITAGQVRLETVSRGPRDPACCQSQRGEQAYDLRDGKGAK